jgi:zinc transport system substrate-binding protein
MPYFLLHLLLILVFGLTIPCANAKSSSLKIVVSTAPIETLVQGILGDKGEITQIVPANMSPHAYTLKPADLVKMYDADVIFWIGPQMETFLVKSIDRLKNTKKVITLIDSQGLQLFPFRTGNNWQSYDQHNHSAVNQQLSANQSMIPSQQMNIDPHIWLDPNNAKKILAAITTTLVELDPVNHDYYVKMLQEKTEELTILDKNIAQELTPIKDKPYLVFHDGYQYLEKHYQLNDQGTVLVNPDVPLSGKQLKEIHEKIQRLKIKCVFSEPQVNEKIAANIVKGTNARLAILDPLDSGLPTGWQGYTALLKKDVRTLLGCLSQ